jgi:carbamoyl-phosphate synthase large subunit
MHRQIELYSAGAPVSNHAPYVFARHFLLPMVGEPTWLGRLNALISREGIDFVYPAHDDVILALAQNHRQVRAKLVTSPLATCQICRFKSRTYRALRGLVPVPSVFSPKGVRSFPVFLKPDRGQGSQDVHRVTSQGELDLLVRAAPDRYLVTEYLPGEEYTVDCFTDRRGRLRYVSGRRRIRVRNGIAVDTETVEDRRFQEYARAISRRMKLRGAWFFQAKRDRRGRLVLLEVAPRIAGSMAIDRVRGVNLPLLSLYDAAGLDVEFLTNRVKVRMDRALTDRFRHSLRFRRAYVDLDDTLVLRDRVNEDLVRLLYQFRNAGVHLTLVTRHGGDVRGTLRRFHLEGLFDSIRSVTREESKANVIDRPRGAIFIDDSFSERREVAHRVGIPTFDCSMLELLADERS